MAEAVVRLDLAKYKYVDLPAEKALELLNAIADLIGKRTSDMQEAERYIRNFNEFYEFMRKKFKDYIAPPHRPDDYIRGDVVIDKVRLYMEGDERRVVLVFDRRIDVELLRKALNKIGYENVRVEKGV
jgi:hypothetical protein